MAGVRKEDKIEAYNSLIVLDFDNLEDIDMAKQDLSQLPYFWYIGTSVSGHGLFGIGSFYYRCHQRGVIPDSIPHYECIPFPVEVLPKKVQEIVRETHLHQNFPIDYIAPCLLFVAALSCGNAAVIEMQTGWKEKPLLYLAIVGGRGTNKTSCFDFALAPIREKDDQEYERYVSEKALYDAEFLKPLKERNPKLEMPMYQQYILSDFTPEVLVRQHKANPRGLIVFFDELIGFIYSFNKYRSGADEQMWTQLFAGGGVTSPVDELPGMQKTIYDELPQSFETKAGLQVAERYGMPERSFKRWLSTSLFRKITHGYYEKRYR